MDYNPEDEMAMATESIATAQHWPEAAHDTILESVFPGILKAGPRGRLFFVHGSGGVGKTYLWNTFGSFWQRQIHNCAQVASSGIAALSFGGEDNSHEVQTVH